jgi:electron transfer flavoprotein beta subunit
MKIVVCIKQVPATHDVKIDPETKRLIREGVVSVINPFDLYAIEQAVLLKEDYGGEAIAITMGPPKAENALRESIACGVDKAILLTDRAFAGSDTWATSYALSMAIRKLGEVDLVICGKQAVDGDTAQVGPGIAAHLGWGQAACVSAMTRLRTNKTISATRMHEEGFDIVEMRLPSVITVVKGINQPRIPTLKGRLASLDVAITTWGASDIGAETEKLGLNGSPTRVVRTSPPPPRKSASVRLNGSAEKCAMGLVKELRTRSIL